MKSQLISEIQMADYRKTIKIFHHCFYQSINNNLFGAETFGKYGYALALTNIFIGLSNLGMPNLIVAQISKYRINRKKLLTFFLK